MKLNIVPPRQGMQWVKLGIRVFMKQPIAMTGLFFMFIALVSLVSMLPVVGSLLALMLLPAATLGYMAATHEAIRGRFPMPTLLFAALKAGKTRLQSMMLLGLGYALCFLGIMGVSMLLDGGTFARFYLVGGKMDADTLMDPDFQTAMYASMALYVPVSLAFWHAPALVHWHGLSPAKSIFFSLVACLRNFKAFAIYGMAWFGLTLAAGLVVSMLGMLVGGQALASMFMMPAILMVASMFFCSLFFTFHDCFIITDGNKSATGDTP